MRRCQTQCQRGLIVSSRVFISVYNCIQCTVNMGPHTGPAEKEFVCSVWRCVNAANKTKDNTEL